MLIRIVLLAAMVTGAAGASAQTLENPKQVPGQQKFYPYGEGLPLPWPFPWAKDCPVVWSSLSGRYSMLDSQYQQEMELKISVLTKDGMKLIRISRYNEYGAVVAEGIAWLTSNQKNVSVHLRPLRKNANPMFANIKLYYASSDYNCQINALVPILSLMEKRPNMTTQVQYRLVRRPADQ